MKKFLRLITPMPGSTVEEIVKAKGRGFLEEALPLLGGRVKSVEELAEKAPQLLLDRGGLRFFGQTLIGGRAQYLTPRASSLRGLIAGNMVETNLPWVTQTLEKAAETKTWKALVSGPLGKLGEKVSRAFRKYHGIDPETRGMIDPILEAASMTEAAASRMSDNLLRYPVGKVSKETRELAHVTGLPVEVLSEVGTKPLTDPQAQLVSRVLLDLRDKGLTDPSLIDRYFDELFINPEHTRRQWLLPKVKRNDELHLNLLGKTSKEELEGMKYVAKRIQPFLPNLRAWEAARGYGDVLDEAYFTRIFKRANKEFDYRGWDHPFFNKERTSLLDYDQVYAIAQVPGQTQVPGLLNDNLREVLHARLSASFGRAFREDAVAAMAPKLRKHPAALGELAKLLTGPEGEKFIAHNPELALTVANLADQVLVPGIERESLRGWEKGLSRLVRQHDAKGVPGLVQELLEGAPRNLTKENIQGLLRTYDQALAEKVADLADIPIESGTYLRNKAAVDAMEKARGIVNRKLNERALERELSVIVRGAAKEAGEWVGPKSPVAPAFRKSLERIKPTPRSIAKTPANWMERHYGAISKKLSQAYGLSTPEQIALDQASKQSAKRIIEAKGAVADWNRFMRRGTYSGEGLREWRYARSQAGAMERRITELDVQIKAITKQKGELLGAARAQATRMIIERDSLVELRKALPKQQVFREYNHVMQRLGEVRELAKKKGAEDYLSAVVHRFIGDQPLATIGKEDMEHLYRMVKGQAVPNKAAVELLTPPRAGEEFARIAGSGKYTVPGVIPGTKVAADKYVFPKEVARVVGAVLDPKKDTGMLEKAARYLIDLPTSHFKRLVTSNMLFGLPRIPFFLRNKVDLAFRGTVGFGLDFVLPTYGKYGDTMKILAGEAGEVIVNGAPLSFDFIRRRLAESGLWRAEFARLGRKPGQIADLSFDRLLKYIDSPACVSFRTMKEKARNYLDHKMPWLKNWGPERWGTGMENAAVIRGLLTQLHAGIPVDQAIHSIQRTLFSYQNLSEFERSIMRRVFPFYSFSRQAVPFIAWTALKRPALFNVFPRARDLAVNLDKEEALIPQWIRDFPFIGLGKSAKGIKLLSMRNTFTVDILPDLMPPLDAEGVRRFFGQVNPFLTIVPEMVLGRDFYMARDIPTRKTIARGLESEFMRNTIGKWLDFEEVQIGGKPYGRVTGWKWHVLRRLWFSRLFREFDTASGILEKQLKPEEISGLLTGFKLYELDLERQQMLLELDAEKAKREYDRARKIGDSKRAKDILEEIRLR